MLFRIVIFLVCLSNIVHGQAAFKLGRFKFPRNSPTFTHAPFLLLRFDPARALEYNNMWNVGAELAPPVGKFAFAFDYGTGKGSQHFNKSIRTYQKESKYKSLHFELKGYFSDWYPFYGLDTKPFGRYYALEYEKNTFDRNLSTASRVGGQYLSNYVQFDKTNYVENWQHLRLKFGKHFHISRHLFLDTYMATGIALAEVDIPATVSREEPVSLLHFGFLKNFEMPLVNKKSLMMSNKAGVRIVVPL